MRHATPLACLLIVTAAACEKKNTTPPGWDAAETQALRLIDEGRNADIVTLYEPFTRDHPDFPEAHLRLGEALRHQALELRGNPNTAALSRQLFERAVVHYEKYHSLESNPQLRSEASRLLALTYDTRGLDDPAKTVAFARRFLEESPKSSLAHEVLAAYLRTGAPRIEPDPAKQKALLAEADRLDAEAKKLDR